MSETTRSNPNANPTEPPSLDLSDRTLGDFRVLRKLGQGGMGQVYLAEQISLKRKVALKILRPEMAASAQALARFKAEAEAVARATHANIVQVYAYGEVDGMPYMALEYVEGRNLKDYINKKGPPELLVALSVMRQVASALQRASEMGIIHRDIKPENILLNRKGEVKVADFGLSRCLEGEKPALSLTQTGVTMGTPLYMSPEQVEGRPVDPRTDIYSFGVTCYHMLAGHPPFRGSTAFEVAVAHVQKQPEPLSSIRSDLPEALCAVVHKMMAKDPAQRYQTGRELLRDISRLRETLSGTSPGLQPTINVDASIVVPLLPSEKESTSASQPVRRQRSWLLAGMLLSFVVAGAAGAAIAWRERRLEGPLPDNADVRPSDASMVENILLPNKREQALRTLVEQSLNLPAGQLPDAGAIANWLELALHYLDQNRLEEAESLFGRMASIQKAESCRMLGLAGQGIVLALRNKPVESNKLFTEVFAPTTIQPRLVGPGIIKPKKTPIRPEQIMRKLELYLAPLRPLLDNARGREWLGKARQYNKTNGIKEDDVARYLLYRYPSSSEAVKK